jgi:hypothetical protein
MITLYTVDFNMGLFDILSSRPAKEERDILSLTKEQQKKSLISLFKKEKESDVINRVAEEYRLDPIETKLLHGIRAIEQGRKGREFGVLNQEAMRFENDPDPVKSLETQARWAAGTIKKRFTGDLKDFADRWAPIGAENDPDNLNKNWYPNILDYMSR